jgi:outer membrane lipoprotein carrier protein
MAFNAKSELVVMELHDAFGHHTVLRFSELKNNPSFGAQQFKFVPPKGADVLGE